MSTRSSADTIDGDIDIDAAITRTTRANETFLAIAKFSVRLRRDVPLYSDYSVVSTVDGAL